MSVISHELVDPNVTVSMGQLPVEVTGVAGQLARVVDKVSVPAVETLQDSLEQQRSAAEILATADPQAWLFVQRAKFLTDGYCDPYAEQMLRRMGLLPRR